MTTETSNLTPEQRLIKKLLHDKVNYMSVTDRLRDSSVIETFMAEKKLRWRFTYAGQLPPTDPIL